MPPWECLEHIFKLSHKDMKLSILQKRPLCTTKWKNLFLFSMGEILSIAPINHTRFWWHVAKFPLVHLEIQSEFGNQKLWMILVTSKFFNCGMQLTFLPSEVERPRYISTFSDVIENQCLVYKICINQVTNWWYNQSAELSKDIASSSFNSTLCMGYNIFGVDVHSTPLTS